MRTFFSSSDSHVQYVLTIKDIIRFKDMGEISKMDKRVKNEIKRQKCKGLFRERHTYLRGG